MLYNLIFVLNLLMPQECYEWAEMVAAIEAMDENNQAHLPQLISECKVCTIRHRQLVLRAWNYVQAAKDDPRFTPDSAYYQATRSCGQDIGA